MSHPHQLLAIILLSLLAADAIGAPPVRTGQKPAPTGSRTKSLDFDEEVVEGVNKKSYDTANYIGTTEPGGAGTLYRKKRDFKKENRRLLESLKALP